FPLRRHPRLGADSALLRRSWSCERDQREHDAGRTLYGHAGPPADQCTLGRARPDSCGAAHTAPAARRPPRATSRNPTPMNPTTPAITFTSKATGLLMSAPGMNDNTMDRTTAANPITPLHSDHAVRCRRSFR